MSDTEHDTPAGVENEPAVRSDEDRELAERLVAEASENGFDLVGPDGVHNGLTKRVLEAGSRGRGDRGGCQRLCVK